MEESVQGGMALTDAEAYRYDRKAQELGIDLCAVARAAEAARPDRAFWGAATGKPLDPRWKRVADGPWESAWRHGQICVLRSVGKELDGRHWLHVSCSKPHSLPTYEEMHRVKEAFIGVEATALSIWPPRSRHVNHHPFCLHLWCCLEGDPLPDFTRGCGTI